METISRFEEIEAWQIARQLSRLVYLLTKEGLFGHDFGLRDQMRRAAVSIMRQISRFMSYLLAHPETPRVHEDQAKYDAETFTR